MKKRLINTDFLFTIALCFGLFFLGIFLYIYPYAPDESFYLTIPFRLVKGDSLVQDEWHLTQFSSLFSYLPTHIWMSLKGSTDGILVFSRCVYLSMHTALTVLIYVFFRKYKIWAAIAAITFFTQATHRILLISYHSVLVAFLLLLSLCIISIYNRGSAWLYVLAGVCYGACCICNPLFCIAFIIYLVFYFFRSYRKSSKKTSNVFYENIISESENNNYTQNNTDKFFIKKAVFLISFGILIAAITAVAFFLLTGGTFSSLFNNIKNLFLSSEYITDDSLFTKIMTKLIYSELNFDKLSFEMPYLLPLLYILLFIDKKRNENSHRCFYLVFSLFLAILYTISVLYNYENTSYYVVELPFAVISTVSYILTEKKNKKLFYCMWVPCSIGALFQFLASNSNLVSISVVFILNNVAGVLFVGDLYKEIIFKSQSESTKRQTSLLFGHSVLCIGVCLQILFHIFFYQYNQLPIDNAVKATTGPFSGVYMSESQHDSYTNSIADMNIIKSRGTESSAVLISSYQNWMYMYIDRPVASYTAWYSNGLYQEHLTTYYKENPDKIPEFIYVDTTNIYNHNNYDLITKDMEVLDEMFEFTKEELSNGILLTIKKYKFN